MEFKYENPYLHPRVKICHVLSKYIKQTGVNQDIVNVVVAKECFALLSKQIVAIQMKQRLLGRDAILDINDNEFYLTEYQSKKDFADVLSPLINEIGYPDFVLNEEHFEEILRDRLISLLTSLVNHFQK